MGAHRYPSCHRRALGAPCWCYGGHPKVLTPIVGRFGGPLLCAAGDPYGRSPLRPPGWVLAGGSPDAPSPPPSLRLICGHPWVPSAPRSQQDAQEFLKFFMDRLHAEINRKGRRTPSILSDTRRAPPPEDSDTGR